MATKTVKTKEAEATPTSVFGANSAWALYRAELSCTGRLYGGNPFDPELVEGWLKKSLGITDEEELRAYVRRNVVERVGLDPTTLTDAEMEAEIEKAVAANAIEKKAQGFKREPVANQPYIEGRHAKAMLKEATSIAYPQGENKWGQYRNSTGKLVGGKAPLSVVAERIWVPDDPIVVAEDSDDFEFAVGHIEDWKGRRSTIGYFEYCEKPVVTITVGALDDFLTLDKWTRIWQVAEKNGLGARRSQGGGQFVVTAWELIG